jgi:predicted component of viral defense system (DUF524 family)
MKLATRVYIDKQITQDGGGEHSRVIDLAELNLSTARSQAEQLLAADETINQIVSVSLDDSEAVI